MYKNKLNTVQNFVNLFKKTEFEIVYQHLIFSYAKLRCNSSRVADPGPDLPDPYPTLQRKWFWRSERAREIRPNMTHVFLVFSFSY